MTDTAAARREIINKLAPDGLPRLWCPPLTHYNVDGGLDIKRMSAHWLQMRPHVKGFLVPGSTGDGWEMDDAERDQLLDFCLVQAAKFKALLLVGILKPRTEAMLDALGRALARIKALTGEEDSLSAMAKAGVLGFTCTAPHGADLDAGELADGLESVLALGLPVAFYQLPQVTGNLVPPGLFAELAEAYPNLIMFKDSGGGDEVASADAGASGIFLTRGAEGDYLDWVEEGGGPYHGLLLGSANCHAQGLAGMLSQARSGNLEQAKKVSRSLTAMVQAAFGAVENVSAGNAFANSNKAVDHFMAHGPGAMAIPAPMLHAGARLPASSLLRVKKSMEDMGFMPRKGYLGG